MTLATAYWCVLIAALLPYAWVSVSKASGERYDNRDPRGWTARQTNPRVRRGERFRPERQPVVATGHAPLYQACLLEDFDVLRGRFERHRERLGELADREITRGESGEHRSPGVVGERVEDVAHGRFLNHSVEYRPSRILCQPDS